MFDNAASFIVKDAALSNMYAPLIVAEVTQMASILSGLNIDFLAISAMGLLADKQRIS